MAKRKRPAARPVKEPKHAEPKRQTRFPNFLLGLTFVIVILLLISLFFRNSGTRLSLSSLGNLFTRSNSPTPIANISPTPGPEKAIAGEQYTVQPGDTLWSIAEEAYGSGFNAQDIITSNKIVSPNQLEEGTVITLPKVEAKAPTRGETAGQAAISPVVSPTQAPAPQGQTPKSYTVKSGDNLWNIAVQVYGDGFQWTRIAEANKLANPHLIHVGNVFTLPPATS